MQQEMNGLGFHTLTRNSFIRLTLNSKFTERSVLNDFPTAERITTTCTAKELIGTTLEVSEICALVSLNLSPKSSLT